MPQFHKAYRIRKKKDPIFRVKKSVGNAIRMGLLQSQSSKKLKSCWWYLDYSAVELKQHLESRFEPWMNWDNWGRYNPEKWDDNDPETWTWQIDHILPHSCFTYDSMDHPEFKKCWALSNLRPLSAKQNLIDGSSRARHQ